MKVICEYCGSYVEADENMRCPLCVAELGSSVKAEQDRLAKEEEAEHQREAEEKAQEAKEEHVSEIIKGVASVATAVVAGLSSSKQEKQVRAVEQRPPMPREGFEHHARHDGPVGPGGPGVPDDRMKHAKQDFPGGYWQAFAHRQPWPWRRTSRRKARRRTWSASRITFNLQVARRQAMLEDR